MKKTVRIKESQLNEIIKNVLKEQGDAQVMTTGPSAEQMSGIPDEQTPENEEGPDFGEFQNCANALLSQGVSVGELVDKIIEAQNEEPESDIEPNPDIEGGIQPETPMNESKKRK